MAKHIIYGARLSYVHVLEPRAKLSGEGEEYSLSAIIDPNDDNPVIPGKPETSPKQSLAGLEAKLRKDAVDKFGPKAEKMLGKSLKWPIRDADAESKEDPAYEGMFFINVRSKRRPQVVNRHMEPIVSEEEIYSGVYANVSLSTFAYDTSGSKGVSAGLNNIQVTKLAERLAGAADASADFDEMGDDIN